MDACVHCGRRVPENIAKCPFCKKDPRPVDEEPKRDSQRHVYRWHVASRDQQKPASVEPETKFQAGAVDAIQAITSGSPAMRDNAIELILSKKINITDQLIATLDNHSQVGREHIAKALGRLGAREAIPTLCKTMGSAERALRLASAWALHRIGDISIVPHLIDNFKDNDAEVRRYIVYVLGGMSDRKASPYIKKALQDVEPGVRRQAILSLMCLEGRTAASAIRNSLKDGDDRVRQVASEALVVLQGNRRGRKIFLIIAVLAVALLAGLAIINRGRFVAKKQSQFPYIISIPQEEGIDGKGVR
ncbi:MAG: HEAT repeat domain-containing protein [Elusimicrobia bacterium]|nr:HEAT repeat domain-containing protein [Elusimicrobiota bacterium]